MWLCDGGTLPREVGKGTEGAGLGRIAWRVVKGADGWARAVAKMRTLVSPARSARPGADEEAMGEGKLGVTWGPPGP